MAYSSKELDSVISLLVGTDRAISDVCKQLDMNYGLLSFGDRHYIENRLHFCPNCQIWSRREI